MFSKMTWLPSVIFWEKIPQTTVPNSHPTHLSSTPLVSTSSGAHRCTPLVPPRLQANAATVAAAAVVASPPLRRPPPAWSVGVRDRNGSDGDGGGGGIRPSSHCQVCPPAERISVERRA